MPRTTYYTWMFRTGAFWNWMATSLLAVGYPVMFRNAGMPPPRYPVFLLLFLALAFVYGIGYYWVSKDLRVNHDIVRLGILGKILVFIGLSAAAAKGNISMLLAGAGVVDLVYALLYIEFLHTAGKHC